MFELAVEAAPVGQAGKAVEARQFLQVLIGDLQFLFARRKLARHVVECGGKRLEFGNPGLLPGVDVQIAGRRAIFLIQAAEGTRLDIAGLQRKSDLFEKEFHLKAEFRRAQRKEQVA